MATIQESLTLAVHHHQAGQLQAAEQIYRQILAVEPENPDALQLLGVFESQQGRHATAFECFRRATELNPGLPQAHSNFGVALSPMEARNRAVQISWAKRPWGVAYLQNPQSP